jgi:hypothetical protein
LITASFSKKDKSKIGGLVKSPNYPVLSFLRKSRAPRDYFKYFWTPAFAGVTVSGLFTDSSKLEYRNFEFV